ncbi:MAG TPA: anti-sigma factor [Paenibacillaceae bacterium]
MAVPDLGCAVPEEWWVDYLTGRLTRDQALRLERHRAICPACAETCRRWEELLRNARESRTPAETASGQSAAGNVRAGGESPLTAALRYLAGIWRRKWRRGKLRLAVSAYSCRRSLERALRGAARPRWLAAAGGALALALVAGLFRTAYVTFTEEPPADPVTLKAEQYVMAHEPMAASVISRPDTVQYPLMRASVRGDVELPPVAGGAVWLNDRTGELLVMLEGVVPSGDRDVQAWLVIREGWLNLGLLKFHEQHQGHLYVRSIWREDREAVALTLEPKGGSPLPTAPESTIVRLGAPQRPGPEPLR